jgi:hypothetical protein
LELSIQRKFEWWTYGDRRASEVPGEFFEDADFDALLMDEVIVLDGRLHRCRGNPGQVRECRYV